MTVMPELLKYRKALGVEHIPIVLGGIVPESDYAVLKEMGVAAVFNPGSPVDEIVEALIVRIGVDGGHQAMGDPEFAVQDGGDRAQAIGGA